MALYAALLGVVQGLSEFLPVSSSGHLILARALFGWDAEELGIAFDVACHVGTLVAVLSFFWRDIVNMVRALPAIFGDGDDAKLARLIAVGTIPTVIVGLTLADVLETEARTPHVALWTLAIGGIGLIVAERLGTQTRSEATLGYGEALAIGAAQALALVPGVSRSGSTMTVALLFGIARPGAARFSFLLGVPAILAAAAKAGLEVMRAGITPHAAQLFGIGLATSAVVGYLTIRFLLRFLAGHSLNGFGYYRLVVAALAAIWLGLR